VWPDTREKVDIELALLQRLLDSHRPILEKVRHAEPDTIELSALSACLHAFYTGIEGIFKRIALEIDRTIPTGDRWHSDLLMQMARPSSYRRPVISSDLCTTLTEYLEFRHVFRHAYTFDLKWNKMSGLILHCEETLKQLETELQVFFESENL